MQSEFWDIAAKVETDHPIPHPDMLVLVQQILADRFQLQLRRETRDVKGYALIVDTHGLKIKPSSPETPYSFRAPSGKWTVTRISMPLLAKSLTREAGARVVDRTGLAGYYDLKLEWAADSALVTSDTSTPLDDRPSIFSAVRNQLGLVLESRKLPTEMLIVERAERPSAN